MAATYEVKRILTNIGPCDPSARYWPKKNTNISHTKTWTGMSMAALFMIVQTTQMSISRWMHRQIRLYPYNEILLSNKKELLTIVTAWMNLKTWIQRCQTWKNTYSIMPLTENSRKVLREMGRGGCLKCYISWLFTLVTVHRAEHLIHL